MSRAEELAEQLRLMDVKLGFIRSNEDGTKLPFLTFPPSYSPTKEEMEKARKIAGELFLLDLEAFK